MTEKKSPSAKTKEEKKKKPTLSDFKLDLEEMVRVGLHFGHRTSRLHPKMEPYLLGVRNTIHIIDVKKTAEKLKEALSFLQKIISEGKILLFVGTKIQHKELVKSLAEDLNMPYVIERWLGGTFTNFEVIKKRTKYLKEIEEKKEKGGLEQYTKKEKIKMEKDFLRLKTKFEGIKNLEKLPDAIFVVDMKTDELAVKEAKMKEIPVVAICDTNTDPTLADYPIPANDDAISSVGYILEKVKKAIIQAKSCRKKS